MMGDKGTNPQDWTHREWKIVVEEVGDIDYKKCRDRFKHSSAFTEIAHKNASSHNDLDEEIKTFICREYLALSPDSGKTDWKKIELLVKDKFSIYFDRKQITNMVADKMKRLLTKKHLDFRNAATCTSINAEMNTSLNHLEVRRQRRAIHPLSYMRTHIIFAHCTPLGNRGCHKTKGDFC